MGLFDRLFGGRSPERTRAATDSTPANGTPAGGPSVPRTRYWASDERMGSPFAATIRMHALSGEGSPHKETLIDFGPWCTGSGDQILITLFREKGRKSLADFSEEEIQRIFARSKKDVMETLLSGHVGTEFYSIGMVLIACRLRKRHGALVKIQCLDNGYIELLYGDGHQISIREHSGHPDITMMKFGYAGTGPECFYAFLNENGFSVSMKEVEAITPPHVMQTSGSRKGAASPHSSGEEIDKPAPPEKKPAEAAETSEDTTEATSVDPQAVASAFLKAKKQAERELAEEALAHSDLGGEDWATAGAAALIGQKFDPAYHEKARQRATQIVAQAQTLAQKLSECDFFEARALRPEERQSYDDMLEEAKQLGETAVPLLKQHLGDGPFVALALGTIGSKAAISALADELGSNDWRRITSAVKALGMTADAEAIPLLEATAQSAIAERSAEVNSAVHGALAHLHQSTKGDPWVVVDRKHPLEQMRHVSQLRSDLSETQRKQAIQWAKEMIGLLPELEVRDPDTGKGDDALKAAAWNLLAITTYYLMNPSDNSFDHPCSEAKYCWEQAVELQPDNADRKEMLERMSRFGEYGK